MLCCRILPLNLSLAAPQESLRKHAIVPGEASDAICCLGIQEQLCTLWGRPVQFHLRSTPDRQVALIDVTMIFKGLNNDIAGLAVRRLLNN